MIDAALVRRTTRTSLILAAAASSLLTLAGGFSHAAGFAAGALLGLLPVWTWSLLLGRAERTRDAVRFALITAAKLAVYGLALWALVFTPRVGVAALAAGLLLPHLVMAVAACRPAPAQEQRA